MLFFKDLTKTRCRSHITPLLASLHWLPISYRNDFTILFLAPQLWNSLSQCVIDAKSVHFIKNMLKLTGVFLAFSWLYTFYFLGLTLNSPAFHLLSSLSLLSPSLLFSSFCPALCNFCLVKCYIINVYLLACYTFCLSKWLPLMRIWICNNLINNVTPRRSAERNFTAKHQMFYTIPYEMSQVLLNTHRSIRQKNIHTSYACTHALTHSHT